MAAKNVVKAFFGRRTQKPARFTDRAKTSRPHRRHSLYADLYARTGDYDRAVADLTQALRLNPNDAFAKEGLEDGAETPAAEHALSRNGAKQLDVVVPAVASGLWRVKVVTQYSGSTTVLKVPRSYTFALPLAVHA